MRPSSTASSQHTRYLIGRLWRASALVVALSVVTANPLKAEKKTIYETSFGKSHLHWKEKLRPGGTERPRKRNSRVGGNYFLSEPSPFRVFPNEGREFRR